VLTPRKNPYLIIWRGQSLSLSWTLEPVGFLMISAEILRAAQGY